MRYSNRSEAKIINSIDKWLNKEKLYLRASQTINKYSENPKEFLKNMIYINLGIAELQKYSRHSNKTLKNNIKKLESQKNKSFNQTIVRDTLDDDEKTWQLLDEYEESIKNIKLWLFRLQQEHSYERWEWFKDIRWEDERLTTLLETFNMESFFFNKIYEMMLVQIIEARLNNIDQDEFSRYKVYKSTTFDDCLSKTDFIVTWKNKYNKARSRIAVDHICWWTKKSVRKKWDSDTALCKEFCSSIWNGNYKPMKRIVWKSQPELSFLLFNRYIKQLATWNIPDWKWLIKQYDVLKVKHPNLYEKSRRQGNRIQDNTKQTQYALVENL